MKRFLLIACMLSMVKTNNAQQARLVFYNVENLFDLQDDTMTNDSEFLPDSVRHWSYERYWQKIFRIYKVISAVDEWDMPAAVGLCEVENREVLEDLVYDTPLEKYGYRFLHRDSPDLRGIDVALIYRAGIFEPDSVAWLKVPLENSGLTREILMVRGRLWKDVPLYIFINHWPSRSGGALASAPRRMAAAFTLKYSLDSLFRRDPMANVILMGDFNDEPDNESLQVLSGMLPNPGSGCSGAIVNLSDNTRLANSSGTIKHRGVWNVFDQVLVSCPMLTGTNGLMIPQAKTDIFNASFLLEPDQSYSGSRPFRTYLGPMYHNGFSDHLPVSILVELILGEER